MRLMILEYYGGFYMDLDMECFRPLSDYFPNINTPLVFDQERTMQSKIYWSKPFITMNSAMISRPGHPFLKLLIEQLPTRANMSEYHLSLNKTPQRSRNNIVSLRQSHHSFYFIFIISTSRKINNQDTYYAR